MPNTETSPFKVGNRVTVLYLGNVCAVRTVVRVTKRFVELKNGDRFQPSGYDAYPKSGNPWGAHRSIRAERPGDVDVIRKAKLVQRLNKTRWEELSLEVLDEIAARLYGEEMRNH